MPTSDPPLVRLERRGAVAILTIDHPPVNVLNAEVLDALVARLAEVDADRSVRAVVLCGAAEKAFAAGADIREMAPMGPEKALAARREGAGRHGGDRADVRPGDRSRPRLLPGGRMRARACLRLRHRERGRAIRPARSESRCDAGLGGTQRLPRRIGSAKARYWIYTGRSVSAAEAMEDGWILQVVPKSRLLEEALILAEELAGKSADALAAAKFALQRAVDRGLTEGLAYELRIWESLFATSDQKEGMRAFLEKRKWVPAERDPAVPDPPGRGGLRAPRGQRRKRKGEELSRLPRRQCRGGSAGRAAPW